MTGIFWAIAISAKVRMFQNKNGINKVFDLDFNFSMYSILSNDRFLKNKYPDIRKNNGTAVLAIPWETVFLIRSTRGAFCVTPVTPVENPTLVSYACIKTTPIISGNLSRSSRVDDSLSIMLSL